MKDDDAKAFDDRSLRDLNMLLDALGFERETEMAAVREEPEDDVIEHLSNRVVPYSIKITCADPVFKAMLSETIEKALEGLSSESFNDEND